MRGIFITILSVCFCIKLEAQEHISRIKEITPYVGTANDNSVDNFISTQALITFSYYDGLGRFLQAVSLGNSPAGHDIIQHTAYDPYGRQVNRYLPYAANEAAGVYRVMAVEDQADFYQNTPKVAVDNRPFSEVVYENSPLNRINEQYGPGQAWKVPGNDKPVRYSYEVNASNEVRLWVIDGEYPSSELPNKYYPAGQLHKNTTIDEEGHELIEFTDKEGRIVLKRMQAPDDTDPSVEDWADTYYIYDDFGNLRFVLPPEAVKALGE